METDKRIDPADKPQPNGQQQTITPETLGELIRLLSDEGYQVVGPTVRDGVVVFGEISKIEDLPQGWTDKQKPGSYRIEQTGSEAFFDCVISAHSCKGHLFPARHRLWRADRGGATNGVRFAPEAVEEPRLAFVGVRACDIEAIRIQDRVLLGGAHVDPVYAERRRETIIVAVNCTRCVDTCFCASMRSGPRATHGFDLALTEIAESASPRFLVETGSAEGERMLGKLESTAADEATLALADGLRARAADDQKRTIAAETARQSLLDNPNHRRWNAIGERCLGCGNCTLTCPTCFCTTVEDTTNLTGESAERWQAWDSCFNASHSYIHGGSVRKSIGSRYRQWIMHKLATWPEQFGTSGCVGCGRCITWCPVGIDITEEIGRMSHPPRNLPGRNPQHLN